MKRTPWGARAYVKRSGVPTSAWAALLGINRTSMQRLLAGHECMQKGPAMSNLIRHLDDIDNGWAEWLREGPRLMASSWRFRDRGHVDMRGVMQSRIASIIQSAIAREISV